ncbi:MAG: nitrophenyl compound nitroreductase subunit ArsF family protein [Rikenellaceae bacterium]
MKRNFFSAIALIIIMGSTVPSSKGATSTKVDNAMEVNVLEEKPEKCSYGIDREGEIVEVLSFHGADRCSTCKAVERLTREVVEQEFLNEFRAGKLRMSVIDITTKMGGSLATKYRVTASSLYINKWSDGSEDRNNMTDQLFAKAQGSPEEFKSQIRSKIKDML